MGKPHPFYPVSSASGQLSQRSIMSLRILHHLLLPLCALSALLPFGSQALTIGTGPLNGVYYPTGGAICRLLNEETASHGLHCSVQSTSGSLANLKALTSSEGKQWKAVSKELEAVRKALISPRRTTIAEAVDRLAPSANMTPSKRGTDHEIHPAGFDRHARVAVRALGRDGQVLVPSEYWDEPTVISRRLIEDGRQRLVLRSPLPLPFPVRLLQGTADADQVHQAVPMDFQRANGQGHRVNLRVRQHCDSSLELKPKIPGAKVPRRD